MNHQFKNESFNLHGTKKGATHSFQVSDLDLEFRKREIVHQQFDSLRTLLAMAQNWSQKSHITNSSVSTSKDR